MSDSSEIEMKHQGQNGVQNGVQSSHPDYTSAIISSKEVNCLSDMKP